MPWMLRDSYEHNLRQIRLYQSEEDHHVIRMTAEVGLDTFSAISDGIFIEIVSPDGRFFAYRIPREGDISAFRIYRE